MASKAEPQAGGTADPQKQSISEQPQGSATEGNLPGPSPQATICSET